MLREELLRVCRIFMAASDQSPVAVSVFTKFPRLLIAILEALLSSFVHSESIATGPGSSSPEITSSVDLRECMQLTANGLNLLQIVLEDGFGSNATQQSVSD